MAHVLFRHGVDRRPAPVATSLGAEVHDRRGQNLVSVRGKSVNARIPSKNGWPAGQAATLPVIDVPSGCSRLPQRSPSLGSSGQVGDRDRERLAVEHRLLRFGEEALSEEELLALLLRNRMWGRSLELAVTLISELGSFERVFTSSRNGLRRFRCISNDDYAMIQLVGATRAIACRREMAGLGEVGNPILDTTDRLMSYLNPVLARESKERSRVLFLDKRNRLLADEAQTRGSMSRTPAYSRKVITRALELHATAIISVHSNPSGDPTPSRKDVEITHALKAAAAAFDVVLHDHIIVASGRWTSFRRKGLL